MRSRPRLTRPLLASFGSAPISGTVQIGGLDLASSAELVGTQSGLGYLISEARFHLDIESVVVGMLAIGVLGVLSDRGMRWLQTVLVPWQPRA